MYFVLLLITAIIWIESVENEFDIARGKVCKTVKETLLKVLILYYEEKSKLNNRLTTNFRIYSRYSSLIYHKKLNFWMGEGKFIVKLIPISDYRSKCLFSVLELQKM